MEKLGKVFSNKLAVAVISFVAFFVVAGLATFNCINWGVNAFDLTIFALIAFGALLVGIGALLKNHALMKTMIAVIGAAFIIFWASHIVTWIFGLEVFDYVTTDYGVMGWFNVIIDFVLAFIVLASIVNYIITVSTKGKKEVNIFINEILAIVAVPLFIAQVVFSAIIFGTDETLIFIQLLLTYVATLFIVLLFATTPLKLKLERAKDEADKEKLVIAVEKAKAEKIAARKAAKEETKKVEPKKVAIKKAPAKKVPAKKSKK